jgi:hypothetical protein
VVLGGATVKPRVSALRGRFLEMRYCFDGDETARRLAALHELI